MNRARITYFAQAAAHLLSARESLRQADAALTSAAVTADDIDDPAWVLSGQVADLRNMVDAIRVSAGDQVWSA